MDRIVAAKYKNGAAGAILLAIAVGMGIVGLAIEAPEPPPTAWEGYRVLLSDSAIPESVVLGLLADAGIDRVLSESTERVLVSDWSKLEARSLVDARGRLSQEDPRLDPFISRLGRWFEARAGDTPCRAYYVDAREPAARITEALAGIKGRTFLPEGLASRRARGGLPFAAALLLILIAASTSSFLGKTETSLREALRKTRFQPKFGKLLLRLALAFPWIILAVGGRDYAAISIFWGIASAAMADILDTPIEEYRSRGIAHALEALKRHGWLPPAAFVYAAIAVALVPSSIASVSVAATATIISAAGYALASKAFSARRRYVPLPIARPPILSASAVGRARALLASATALAWGLAVLLSPVQIASGGFEFEYPRPLVLEGGARPSIAEARSRLGGEADPALPGIASFLEHRALQEALPYIRLGEKRGDPFAEASLPLPGGESLLLTFDDAWARRAYASLPALGIESMLLAQGRAVVGSPRSSAPMPPRADAGRPLAPIRYLLYIFLLVAPLARFTGGFSLARKSAPGELRQEA